MKRLGHFSRLMALCVLAAHTAPALAQGYPSKPIRIVVPFTSGGPLDIMARLIGPKMADALNQPVLVENRPGAGGVIGADLVAKAAPDGYTILMHSDGLALAPSLYRKLPFDAANDFIRVTQLLVSPLILVAGPKVPATSTKELIAMAKSKPGSLSYGHPGVGAASHLAMELLKLSAGIDILAIPYKGPAQIIIAVMAGEVDLAVVPLGGSLPSITAGRFRALGVTGARRVAVLPDVLTVAEAGVTGFEHDSLQGLFVPATTPRDIVESIHRESAKALAMPDVRDRFLAMGLALVGSTPEEFDAKFRADLAKFARIIKEARIPLQD